ncbi:MAG: phenylacetate--CoA ligase [Actinobacteria bacterium HGW-Actinobacteria-10]|jgi:phenylacetate-CoA ligase|nr:MAG: phenylacetate--CoA ligase [Actinobacteria bacterium HGW-Actinobacteria-10]
MAIWNSEYECMDREALRDLQLRKLRATVAWVHERVPHYRSALDDAGIKPKDVRSLEDVRLLPFTDKQTMRDTYPFGLFAVPLDEVVRIHSSSGTTGKPIVVGYTRGDIATWTELTARVCTAAGVGHKDLAQMAFGYGMFTGGFGMHYGLERVGASVIPASAGNTERHLMMMQDFGTTVLVSTPSYALYIAEVGEAMGIDFESLPLRVGLFGAEPCTEAAAREISEKLHIRATDNYGLSEVMGPGVSGECECNCGLHVNEDHFLFEIVDPATGEVLPEGSQGELVITPLSKEAFPVLRYRTHDITRLHYEPCECGRTLARMEKVRARTDDMLIIRGVNVFPSQIEDVLFQIEGIRPHYLIVVGRKHGLDDIEVRIEVAEEVFSDIMADMVAFTRHVGERLQTVLGLNVKVTLVEPGTIERTAGKAKKVLDQREGC